MEKGNEGKESRGKGQEGRKEGRKEGREGGRKGGRREAKKERVGWKRESKERRGGKIGNYTETGWVEIQHM